MRTGGSSNLCANTSYFPLLTAHQLHQVEWPVRHSSSCQTSSHTAAWSGAFPHKQPCPSHSSGQHHQGAAGLLGKGNSQRPGHSHCWAKRASDSPSPGAVAFADSSSESALDLALPHLSDASSLHSFIPDSLQVGSCAGAVMPL